MKEIVTEEQANLIILWVSIAVTLLSIAFAFYQAPKIQKQNRKLFWVNMVICAFAGPVIWGFWQVYNSIENYYGLDSLKALKINFFIAVGLGIAFFAVFSLVPRVLQAPPIPRRRK